MTDTARDRLTVAQSDLDAIIADTARIEEFVAWLRSSVERVDRFDAYYRDQWMLDREEPDAPDLPVVGEDPGYDGITAHMRAVQALARASFDAVVRDYER